STVGGELIRLPDLNVTVNVSRIPLPVEQGISNLKHIPLLGVDSHGGLTVPALGAVLILHRIGLGLNGSVVVPDGEAEEDHHSKGDEGNHAVKLTLSALVGA